MNWITETGKIVKFNASKYKIDWDKKAPSKGAEEVKKFLRSRCYADMIGAEVRIPRTLLRIDFVNWTKRFAIEFDGGKKTHHDHYNPFFHKGSRINFLNNIKRDMKKAQLLEKNGIFLVTILETDLPLTPEWFKENHNIYL